MISDRPQNYTGKDRSPHNREHLKLLEHRFGFIKLWQKNQIKSKVLNFRTEKIPRSFPFNFTTIWIWTEIFASNFYFSKRSKLRILDSAKFVNFHFCKKFQPSSMKVFKFFLEETLWHSKPFPMQIKSLFSTTIKSQPIDEVEFFEHFPCVDSIFVSFTMSYLEF